MSRHLAFTLLMVCGQALAAGSAIGAMAHQDPWIWIIGGFGAAVVYVKNPPTTRSEAMVNGLISVMIGGLISPPVAAYSAAHVDPTLSSPYPFAFVLSSAWPWIMPSIFEKAKAIMNSFGSKPVPKKAPPRRRRTLDDEMSPPTSDVNKERGEQS